MTGYIIMLGQQAETLRIDLPVAENETVNLTSPP
jgi:hypothetical protein